MPNLRASAKAFGKAMGVVQSGTNKISRAGVTGLRRARSGSQMALSRTRMFSRAPQRIAGFGSRSTTSSVSMARRQSANLFKKTTPKVITGAMGGAVSPVRMNPRGEWLATIGSTNRRSAFGLQPNVLAGSGSGFRLMAGLGIGQAVRTVRRTARRAGRGAVRGMENAAATAVGVVGGGMSAAGRKISSSAIGVGNSFKRAGQGAAGWASNVKDVLTTKMVNQTSSGRRLSQATMWRAAMGGGVVGAIGLGAVGGLYGATIGRPDQRSNRYPVVGRGRGY